MSNITSRKKPRSLFDSSPSIHSASSLHSPGSSSLPPSLHPSSPKRRRSGSGVNLGSPSFDIELSPLDGASVELSSPELSQIKSPVKRRSGGGGGGGGDGREGFSLGGLEEDEVEDEEDEISEIGDNDENEEEEDEDEEEEGEGEEEEDWEDEVEKAEVKEELADLKGVKVPKKRGRKKGSKNRPKHLPPPPKWTNPFSLGDKVTHPDHGDGEVTEILQKGFIRVLFGCGVKSARYKTLTKLGEGAVLDLTKPPTPVKIGRGDWVTHGEWGRGRVREIKGKSWTWVKFDELGDKCCRLPRLTFLEHGVWEESDSEEDVGGGEVVGEVVKEREIDHGAVTEDPATGRTWRVRVSSAFPTEWKVGEEVRKISGPDLGEYVNEAARRERVPWYLQCRSWSTRGEGGGEDDGSQGGAGGGVWVVLRDTKTEEVKAEVCARFGRNFVLVKGAPRAVDWLAGKVEGRAEVSVGRKDLDFRGRGVCAWAESEGECRVTWGCTEGVREGGVERITVAVPDTAWGNFREGTGGEGMEGLKRWVMEKFKVDLGFFEVIRVKGGWGEVGGDKVKFTGEVGWRMMEKVLGGGGVELLGA
ncbi:hypothetical protein TrCOL_g12940 [Triparma columacea]|uniref:Uncharacterized protein n=1 Tax=Triparma columacea TaxID=722753 RepID=A0A9W7GCQ9_9STRA|nr:hypothetical protein TrCOL_g12940 [Triparma columacea]